MENYTNEMDDAQVAKYDEMLDRVLDGTGIDIGVDLEDPLHLRAMAPQMQLEEATALIDAAETGCDKYLLQLVAANPATPVEALKRVIMDAYIPYSKSSPNFPWIIPYDFTATRLAARSATVGIDDLRPLLDWAMANRGLTAAGGLAENPNIDLALMRKILAGEMELARFNLCAFGKLPPFLQREIALGEDSMAKEGLACNDDLLPELAWMRDWAEWFNLQPCNR